MPVCVSGRDLVSRAMIALILWNPLVLACLFLSFHLVLPAVPAVPSQRVSPADLPWSGILAASPTLVGDACIYCKKRGLA